MGGTKEWSKTHKSKSWNFIWCRTRAKTTANFPVGASVWGVSVYGRQRQRCHTARLWIPVLWNFPALSTTRIYSQTRLHCRRYLLTFDDKFSEYFYCSQPFFPNIHVQTLHRTAREREKERRYSIRANIFLCERLVRRAISKYRPKCRANHDKQIYWDIWMEMRLMSYIEFGGKVFFSLLIHFTSHEAKQKEKKIYSKIYFAPKSLWLCFRSCIWADGWWVV